MLVTGFDRATRRLVWGGIPASMLMWGLLELSDLHPPKWMVLVPFLAVWGALFWWAWSAPLRLLDGRAPVARGLTGGEAWRDNMRTLPWAVLVAGALIAIGLAVRLALGTDPWAPDNRGGYAYAATLLAFFVAMAVAKRRAG